MGYGEGMKSDPGGVSASRGAERARWVREYRGSGMSLKAFAKRHGMSAGQLHYWVYGLDKAGAADPVPMFQEVQWATTVTPGAWIAEVGLPDGITVRLARGTDWKWAKGLVESLRTPCLPR